MYLYVFREGRFLYEVAVHNYSEFDIEIEAREIQDKYGENVEIYQSDVQIEDPSEEKMKHAMAS